MNGANLAKRINGVGNKRDYHHLYRDPRWCGPNGIRRQALLRDLYTCRRCGCIVIRGNPSHP